MVSNYILFNFPFLGVMLMNSLDGIDLIGGTLLIQILMVSTCLCSPPLISCHFGFDLKKDFDLHLFNYINDIIINYTCPNLGD